MRTLLTTARPFLLLAAALVLAAGAGTLAAVALGTGSADPPRTVTVDVTPGPTGPQGPEGPPGPTGPAGSATCPAGYSPGKLVINHPGGHTAIWTCLED